MIDAITQLSLLATIPFHTIPSFSYIPVSWLVSWLHQTVVRISSFNLVNLHILPEPGQARPEPEPTSFYEC